MVRHVISSSVLSCLISVIRCEKVWKLKWCEARTKPTWVRTQGRLSLMIRKGKEWASDGQSDKGSATCVQGGEVRVTLYCSMRESWDECEKGILFWASKSNTFIYRWKAVLYERPSENIESTSKYARISGNENKGKHVAVIEWWWNKHAVTTMDCLLQTDYDTVSIRKRPRTYLGITICLPFYFRSIPKGSRLLYSIRELSGWWECFWSAPDLMYGTGTMYCTWRCSPFCVLYMVMPHSHTCIKGS